MNTYEQFKNRFLVELENSIPDLARDHLYSIGQVLDRAAYPYDISVKETSLVPSHDLIPSLVKTYIVVKKTEGLSDGTLSNYARKFEVNTQNVSSDSTPPLTRVYRPEVTRCSMKPFTSFTIRVFPPFSLYRPPACRLL